MSRERRKRLPVPGMLVEVQRLIGHVMSGGPRPAGRALSSALNMAFEHHVEHGMCPVHGVNHRDERGEPDEHDRPVWPYKIAESDHHGFMVEMAPGYSEQNRRDVLRDVAKRLARQTRRHAAGDTEYDGFAGMRTVYRADTPAADKIRSEVTRSLAYIDAGDVDGAERSFMMTLTDSELIMASQREGFDLPTIMGTFRDGRAAVEAEMLRQGLQP